MEDRTETQPSAPPDRAISWKSALTIVVFGASLMTVRFGPGWVLTYHEVYFSQPAREFLEAGDWLSPKILGETNYQKPPLTCWLIAGSMWSFGSDAEWVVRLPSLLADQVAALTLAMLVARWYGDRVGLLTGLLHLTTFYSIFQSRLAEADMPLCAAVIVGMYCFARGAIDDAGNRRAWALGYFAAAVAAFHIKGPVGPAFVGLPCGFYAILTRRRGPWRLLLDPFGWVLLLVGCVGYFVTVYLRDPTVLDDFRVHNLDRFTGAMPSEREGPLYYLYMGPLIFLPWTPLLVPGARALANDRDRPRDFWRFLACWAGVITTVITLSAWKHKHYVIPALPPLSILAALGLVRLEAIVRPAAVRTAFIGGVVALLACCGAAVWGLSGRSALMTAVAPALAAGAIGSFVLAVTRLKNWRRGSVPAVFATAWVVVVLVQSLVMPLYDRYRPQTELAQQLESRRGREETVDFVALIDPQVVWYVVGPRSFTRSVEDYVSKIATEDRPGERLVVLPELCLKELRVLGSVETVVAPVAPNGLTAVRIRPDADRMAELRKSPISAETRIQ
jgi:4-amino-4-deoxy-L-arabinose transferase-like glycosyltransferase